MLARILCLLKDEDGATLVEYALMLALVFSVCVISVMGFGLAVGGSFNKSVAAMP